MNGPGVRVEGETTVVHRYMHSGEGINTGTGTIQADFMAAFTSREGGKGRGRVGCVYHCIFFKKMILSKSIFTSVKSKWRGQR